MKTEIMQVTPEQAKIWLLKNTNNRKIRTSAVALLKDTIIRGEWLLTHQGIAFNDDGVLIDGQHRLHAIVEANCPVYLMVNYGVNNEEFKVIDAHKPRTLSDRTKIYQKSTEVLTFLIKLASKYKNVTSDQVLNLYSIIENEISDINEKKPTHQKYWWSCGFRSGALLNILIDKNRFDYAIDMVHNLCSANFDYLPKIGQQALKYSILNGFNKHGGGEFQKVMFRLGYVLCNPENKNKSKIGLIIVNNEIDLNSRFILQEEIKKRDIYKINTSLYKEN